MSVTPKGRNKYIARKRRQFRGRKKIFGTPERPRLVVTRSNRNISAQIIDDSVGRTLAAASTLEAELRGSDDKKVDQARAVGELIGKRAKEAGITEVVFDRAGNKYHGRVAAVAEGAREAGLSL